MLSASAYSFRQKSRLAISLSWVAGYVNVIAFAICGQVISHMTGNTSHLGLSVGQADWRGIAFFGFLVGSFFTGAIASAVMTEGARRRGATSKYILPLAIEGILLATLAITISTSGVSRSRPCWPRSRSWPGSSSLTGTSRSPTSRNSTCWPTRIGPATPRSSRSSPPELGIYRLTHHRRDQKHGMPDLGAWVERLPRHWKVVILAVSPLTAFDPDAALDLSAAVRKLEQKRGDTRLI